MEDVLCITDNASHVSRLIMQPASRRVVDLSYLPRRTRNCRDSSMHHNWTVSIFNIYYHVDITKSKKYLISKLSFMITQLKLGVGNYVKKTILMDIAVSRLSL